MTSVKLPRIAAVSGLPYVDESTLGAFRARGVEIDVFPSERNLLEWEADPYDLALLPDTQLNGWESLRHIKDTSPSTRVIILASNPSVAGAVTAMKAGASDYLTPPLSARDLLAVIEQVLEYGREETPFAGPLPPFAVGASTEWKDVVARARRVASSLVTVLITGETGTGKDVLARLIVSLGPRHGQPLVAVNCAAIPESLIESELFGHARGAFSGATAARRGLFEEASSGTLFLDEIGAMPVAAQARLLRVLEEKAIRRVGENRLIPVDVRIIAATALDLEAAIARKEFREDLFYRLSVAVIRVPSLRERSADIPVLYTHFLQKAANGKEPKRLNKSAAEFLERYPFPGNVRELRHAIEQAVVFSEGPELTRDDFPSLLARSENLARTESRTPREESGESEVAVEDVAEALRKTNGNRVEAARLLKISRSTLYRLLKRCPDSSLVMA